MSRKIVFFDIDGTLYDKEKNISASTVEAIQQLKKENVYVAIATGRAPFMYEDLRENLGIDAYISFNGSYVVFRDEVIYKAPLHIENLKKLDVQARELGHPMVFLDADDHYTNHESHPHIQESINLDLRLHYPHYNPTFYHEKEVYQALVFCEEHDTNHYVERHNYFEYVRWHKYSIDVLPPGGSKARGIEAVLQKLSIDQRDSYAFGDGLNDIEMLSFVGTGVAMGNGFDEVKSVANVVTRSVEEDGIYFGLRKVGLIK